MKKPKREQPKVADNQLPQGDPNLERAMVGAIMLDPKVLPEVQMVVEAEDLTDSLARMVYGVILEMREEGGAIDVVTVGHRLKHPVSGKDFVETLAVWCSDVPSASGCLEYARLVKRVSSKRKIAEQLILYSRTLNTSHDGLEQATEVARQMVEQLPDEAANRPVTAAKILEEEEAKTEGGRRAPDTTTGIEDLDSVMDFFDPGSYTIVAGRPSQGKSTFLRQLVRLNCDKVACLVYSLEDPDIVFLDSMACSESKVDMRRFWDAKTSQDDDIRVFAARHVLAKRPIYFYPKYLVDASLVRAHVEALKAKHERLAIFIDYVQQMEHREGDTHAERISNTSRILKLMALEFKVPVILAAQCRRDSDSRVDARPELSDLKDCGQLEADADNVVFIFSDEPMQNYRRLLVAKRRHGRRQEIKAVTFFQATGIFTGMPKDEQPEYTSRSRIRTSEPKKVGQPPTGPLFGIADAAQDDVGF